MLNYRDDGRQPALLRHADCMERGSLSRLTRKTFACTEFFRRVTFDNFCAINLATALEHHRANQFFEGRTNLNFVQPKLFQTSRQDDLRFSDCTVSIQILDDADGAFRISGTELRTVLSATPCSQTGRTASTCFHDLAFGYRTHGWATRAAGYRAAISCMAEVAKDS
jgi:hypothetical protein